MMTEAFLIKELDAATNQLNLWWKNKIKEGTFPKKLENRIKFLRGYLKAIKLQKDEAEMDRILTRIKGEYWGDTGFISKL